MMSRLQVFWGSAGMRRGLFMAATMFVAGGLDYGVNVLAGRWLVPVEYGVFVAVAAILQVLVNLTNAIRNVVAFYTAELSAKCDRSRRVGAFVKLAWRWSWKWGLLSSGLMFLLSPLLAHALRISSPWPLWAASPALLLFFVRPVTDGALQGIQAFAGFGLVQVTQSFLRITFAAVLIWLGFEASGAIFALPLACAAALGLALFFLRSYFRDGDDIVDRSVSWHYSAHTLLGLSAFAVLSNVDAVFVKRFFSPEVAGNYGPVVTLAKVSSFLPLAIGILLFPKVTQRQVVGRDPRPILLAAITATLAPGLVLTALYFTFPGQLVRIIFANAYADPGIVLGLATLAATFYAGLNIWLNYALSLGRPAFVYVLGSVLIGQALGMYVLGRESLVAMTLVMVAAGLIGNVAGFATTWFTTVKPAISLQATG